MEKPDIVSAGVDRKCSIKEKQQKTTLVNN